MKRFTFVKLFLSLAILVLIPALSRPDVARAQQPLNPVDACSSCGPPCKKVLIVVNGKKVCDCLCPINPPID
jgi:hypothetical protein